MENVQINGTESPLPKSPLGVRDRVTTADSLQEKLINGEPVPHRQPKTVGTIVAVRDASLGELQCLVRHDNDGKMAAYAFEELTLIAPTVVRAQRFTTMTIDMQWPGVDDHAFEAPLRAPARFIRAYPLMVKPKLAGQAPELKLRLVFLIGPDSEPETIGFMLQRPGQFMQVLDDGGPRPKHLDCVAHPMDGVPISIWQMNHTEAEKPAPIVNVNVDTNEVVS